MPLRSRPAIAFAASRAAAAADPDHDVRRVAPAICDCAVHETRARLARRRPAWSQARPAASSPSTSGVHPGPSRNDRPPVTRSTRVPYPAAIDGSSAIRPAPKTIRGSRATPNEPERCRSRPRSARPAAGRSREVGHEADEGLGPARLRHPARDRGLPGQVVGGLLVRCRGSRIAVRLVQHEPGRVVGRLQDVEPEAAGLARRPRRGSRRVASRKSATCSGSTWTWTSVTSIGAILLPGG